MATVRNKPNKSGNFQALYFDHKGKRRTVTMPTKSKALKVAKLKEAVAQEIKLGLRPAPSATDEHLVRPIEEVVKEYLSWGAAQGGRRGKAWSEVHTHNRKTQLEWWVKHLKLVYLAELIDVLPRAEKALRGLLKVGRAGKTVSNYAETLRAFCLWCRERRYLPDDPLRGLAAFDTAPRTHRRAMTKEEAQQLLNASPPHRRLLYEVAIYSGLRANELRNLAASDLDEVNSGVHLRAEWTKNRQDGFQPLPQSLVQSLVTFVKSGAALRLYKRRITRKKSGNPYPAAPLLHVHSNTSRAIDDDLEAAGIAKWTSKGKLDFHAIRVAFVNFVLDSKANAKETQTLARHASPTLTMNRYGRVRNDRLAEVVESVAANLGFAADCVPTVYSRAVDTEQKSATLDTTESCALMNLAPEVGLEPTTK